MLSKSIRGLLVLLIMVGLASCGSSPPSDKTQVSPEQTFLVGRDTSASAFVTGFIFTQPVDPSGKLFLSSWLDPNGSDFDQFTWDNFTLPSDQTITEIDWIGTYDPMRAGLGGPVLDFRVWIYPSIAAGTEPAVAGLPLVQYQTGGNAGETSINPVNGIPIYSYAFSLPTPFNASAGVKYWVHIVASQGGSSPDWSIAAGTGGDASHYRWGSGSGGDSGYRTVPGDTAFTLLGPVPDKITPTIIWANPADITYGMALSETQLNATDSVPGTFVYTPVAGTILNAGVGQILSVDFTPTDTANYNSVLGATVTINVNQATPILSVANSPVTYDGTDKAATVVSSVTGSVSNTLMGGSATQINAGTYVVTADFISSDANYTDLIGAAAGDFVIDKATPTVMWANPVGIPFGMALSGTQLNATASVPGTFVYTPVAGTILNAGAGQILSVDFTPTDTTNYNSVFGTTVTINVNKATPTVAWVNPADIVYGTVLSGTQLNATASVPGTFVYTPPVGAILNASAGQILSVDFTPTDTTNYTNVLGTTVTINVNKATATVMWANPADITYGTALSVTQLNATASVPGTFVYTPAAGTILNAGAGQILSVDFTPTDSINYNSVLSTTVTINVVNKITPKVTWANPADITYGTALSGAQLNATASVSGTFAYTPAAGTILNVGIGQILSVDFTPTDTTTYNSVLGTTVTINVINPTPTNTPGKITGGGSIGPKKGGNKATFGFTVVYAQGDPTPKGNLTYIDHETGMRLSDTSIDLLVINDTHAWFTGTAMVNGARVRFEVEIDALSKLGQSDTFYIYIPALNNYSAGGAVTGGNVTIH